MGDGLPQVDIMLRREESGRIVIEPMRHKEFDLAELLDEITGTNVHRETDACASRQRGLAMARQGVPNAGNVVWISFNPQE